MACTALLACTALVGCASEPPLAPTWEDAPATIAIRQGERVSVPVRLTGDGTLAPRVETDDPDLRASLHAEPLRIELDAGHRVAGSRTVRLTTDGPGGTDVAEVPVEVHALEWEDDTVWEPAEGPEGREHPVVILDHARDRLILYAGSGYSPYLEPLADAWSFDLDDRTWTELEAEGDLPPGGGSRRAAVVADEGRALLFGGYTDERQALDELYEMDFSGETIVFRRIGHRTAPPARTLHAFFHDPETDHFYAWGGLGFADGAYRFEPALWRMRLEEGEAVWEEVPAENEPPARYGFAYGFDPEAGMLLVFSGAGGLSPVRPLRDTWRLDVRAASLRWEMLTDGEDAPPGRRNMSFAYDEERQRLFVFGGTADAAAASPGVFVFDGRPDWQRWTELDLEGGPAPRSSGFGVWDPTRKRFLAGLGNDSRAIYPDLNVIGYGGAGGNLGSTDGESP